MTNKKIKNATTTVIDGIEFKSKLELMVYETLKRHGFSPKHEEETFILLDGFKPSIPFYTKNKNNIFVCDDSKIRPITYTPDFTFEYQGKTIIIEAKGFANDVYPYKRKLFRKALESKFDCDYIFVEIYSRSNLLEFIRILKDEKKYVPKHNFDIVFGRKSNDIYDEYLICNNEYVLNELYKYKDEYLKNSDSNNEKIILCNLLIQYLIDNNE